jgi:hypothetical protein
MSFQMGIFLGLPAESLAGRGIETAICGKLRLDKRFHRLISGRFKKITKRRISNVFSGGCQVGHFVCNLLFLIV